MKKVFTAIILTVAMLLSLTSVSASIKVPERTSNKTWVEDYADVLSSETEAYIQEKSQILADEYSACIMVVTVDFVTGSIDDYALAIFNQWKLGDSSLNNGVLLLLSIGDDDYYMMIGRGLEDDFPIYDIQQLLDNYLEPSFAVKDYDRGVRRVYEKTYDYIDQVIYGNTGGNGGGGNGGTNYTYNWFMLRVELLIIIVVIIMIYRIVTRATRRYYQPTYYYTRPRYRTYTTPFTYRPSTYYSYDHYRPSGSSHSSGGSSYSGGGGGSSHSSSSHSSSHSSSFGSGSSFGGSSRGAGAGRHH